MAQKCALKQYENEARGFESWPPEESVNSTQQRVLKKPRHWRKRGQKCGSFFVLPQRALIIQAVCGRKKFQPWN
jgi:hypothetical protein